MKLLTALLVLMIVWVPNQLHLPADLGLKGLNSINLLFAAIVALTLAQTAGPAGPTPLRGLFLFFLAMLVWAFGIGQIYDRSAMIDDLTALKNAIVFVCLYFVFFHAVRDRRTIHLLFGALLVVATVAGIEAIREAMSYGFGVYSETRRAAGPFGSDYKASNLAAVYYSMALPMFAGVALYARTRPLVRIAAIAGAAIVIIGTFSTYSRQAYFIIAVLLVLMTLRRSWFLGLLIGVAVWNFDVWVPEGVVDRIEMTGQQADFGETKFDESTESRFVLWEGAAGLISARPWGIGLNHFKREIGSQVPRYAGMDAHNALVLITTEGGIVAGLATLALCAGLLALGWRFWRLADTPDAQAIALGFLGATIAMILGNVYGSRLLDGAVTGSYWILAALVARYTVLLQTGAEPAAAATSAGDAALRTGAAARRGPAPPARDRNGRRLPAAQRAAAE